MATSRTQIYILGAWLALLLTGCASPEPVYREIPTEGFAPALRAWNTHHPERKINPHDRRQIIAIADNLLLMQRNSGGWAPNLNPFRQLSPDERLRFARDQGARDASFANHNIFPQIFYLSHVYLQTGDVRYRNSARRALKLVLESQRYNGGWTRAVTPPEGETIVDATATVDALLFLRQVAAGKMPYGYVPFDVRRQAADAVRKGDQLLLRLQQADGGHLSIWASAYSLADSQPAAAEGEAVAALNAPLGVRIVRYFMEIQRPPAELVRSIEGAVNWYRRNTLQRWRVKWPVQERARRLYSPVTLPPEPVWARRYGIEQSAPLLALASPNGRHRWLTHPEQTGTWARELIANAYPNWRESTVIPMGRPSL